MEIQALIPGFGDAGESVERPARCHTRLDGLGKSSKFGPRPRSTRISRQMPDTTGQCLNIEWPTRTVERRVVLTLRGTADPRLATAPPRRSVRRTRRRGREPRFHPEAPRTRGRAHSGAPLPHVAHANGLPLPPATARRRELGVRGSSPTPAALPPPQHRHRPRLQVVLGSGGQRLPG